MSEPIGRCLQGASKATREATSAVIVSDLHIGSRFFLHRTFERFLEEIPAGYELILNGDILDNLYARLSSPHQRILDLIERFSLQHGVVWIRGNHDTGYLPEEFGMVRFRRIHTIGGRLLIAHGHDFDEIMPRSRAFMRAFAMMHRLRVRLGAKPVHVAEYAKKWAPLYRVLRRNVMINAVRSASENGFREVVCGHTHFAEDVVYRGVRYINTGAWTESPVFYLLVRGERMALMRYETDGVPATGVRHQGKTAL